MAISKEVAIIFWIMFTEVLIVVYKLLVLFWHLIKSNIKVRNNGKCKIKI